MFSFLANVVWKVSLVLVKRNILHHHQICSLKLEYSKYFVSPKFQVESLFKYRLMNMKAQKKLFIIDS